MVLILVVGIVLGGAAVWRFFSEEEDLVTLNTPKQDSLTESAAPPRTPKLVPHPELNLGQLFMIGHWSNTPVASTTDLIKEYGFGGVIIMDAPEDYALLKDWIKEWNSVSETLLLVGIDQEGGTVTRLKGPDFIQTSQREISTEAQAYEIGKIRGQELASLDININFAPVLDTALSPTSFMYERTFFSATNSAALAAAMIAGMESEGVIAAPKHFPGHPDSSEDSHTALPIVDIDKDELVDFTNPFNALFAIRQPQVLMTAHILFPKIDTLPATLSDFFLTEYLRGNIGYQNIIITDDMIMDAIDTQWTTNDATIMAFKAGADIILFAAEPALAISALKAVKDASETDDSLEQKLILSQRRSQKMKYLLQTK